MSVLCKLYKKGETGHFLIRERILFQRLTGRLDEKLSTGGISRLEDMLIIEDIIGFSENEKSTHLKNLEKKYVPVWSLFRSMIRLASTAF